MQIELINAPTVAFREMLLNNIRPVDRKRIEGAYWGAVGLVQGALIDIYWATDIAEKASQVSVALVMGNCPQHIQMLAILGKQAAVKQALSKIDESSGYHGKTESRHFGRGVRGFSRDRSRR